MKRLIVTRADKNIKEMIDLTHPIIRKFAESWNADFKILDHRTDCRVGDGRYHYRIMKLYDLFNKYDRIIHLDSDIVINKTCPNLFEVVPEDCIGTNLEDKGSRRNYRRKMISLVQQRWGNIGWKEGYINTGVFVVSKQHRKIFTKVNDQYWTEEFGFDDVHLGYQIRRFGFKIYELDYRFNHMSMYSEDWNGNKNPLDSYIIHFAGGKYEDRILKIKGMINKIYGI